MRRVLLAGAILVGLVTCASTPPAIPPAASQGGPVWFELTSEHFTVWTDSSLEEARTLVRHMEHMRQVVLGVSFFQKDSPARSFVIAFRNMEEVRAYVPAQFIAHAWSGRNPLGQPIIVLSTSSLEHDGRIVTHELTHVIAFNLIPEQPSWFAEGLAGYFETVRLDARDNVEVGRPLEFRVRQIRDHGLTPSAAMFACEQAACMDDSFYATTWALLTYLINDHPTNLMRYMQRLTETPKAEQSKLWAEVFPALPPATLDRVLAQWAAYGKVHINEYKLAFTEPAAAQRPLVDADALAARGLLRFLFAWGTLPEEITQALVLDPSAVLPNVIAAVAAKAMDAEKARAVVAAHPDDWRAWWLLGLASLGSPESREARIKMCALLEKNPAVLPPQACAPAALVDPANDPRRLVFQAAVPQVNACFVRAKGTIDPTAMSLEIDIADSGAVTGARAAVGSPEVNACIEVVLRGLSFPPHYPGLYRINSKH